MSVAGKLLTNDRLKAIMTDAFVARGLCTDVDSTYATGIYNMGDNTAGIQGFNNAKYGVLVVINQGTNIWFQCIIPWQCSYLLFRSGNRASWQSWMRIPMSSVGGVKYYPSLQKGGGLYEYGWNSPHGREAERVAAERDGVQRGHCKPRYMHATWDISDYLSYDMCITATASRSTLAICSPGSSCSRRGSLSKTDMQERMRSSSDCKWNRNKLERYGFGLNLLTYGKEVAA